MSENYNDNISERLKLLLMKNKKEKNIKLELDNLELITLPSELKEYTWIQVLNINNCSLDSLNNLPPNITILNATKNKIKSLSKLQLPDYLQNLNLENNLIDNIESLSNNLQNINLNYNKIKYINIIFPSKLKKLLLRNNKLKTIYLKTTNIKSLDLSNNNFYSISNLPNSLEILDCSNNKINYIIIPNNLRRLIANNNNISNILHFPSSLEYIDLSKNYLTWLPILPDNLKKGIFKSNCLQSVCDKLLPLELEELDLSLNNKLILNEILRENKKIKYDHNNETNNNMSLIHNKIENNYKNINYNNYNNNKILDNHYQNYINTRMNMTTNLYHYQSKYNNSNPNYIIMKKRIII